MCFKLPADARLHDYNADPFSTSSKQGGYSVVLIFAACVGLDFSLHCNFQLHCLMGVVVIGFFKFITEV